MKIRLLTFEGCPSASTVSGILNRLLEEEGITDPVELVNVDNPEQATKERFLGSPSIQINDLDIEIARRGDAPLYGCRLYQSGGKKSGIPPEGMIRDALRKARATE